MPTDDFDPLRVARALRAEPHLRAPVEYVKRQEEAFAANVIANPRGREVPDAPWPAMDNPMFAYLLEEAMKVMAADGVESAFAWIGAHAWMEGHVEALTGLRPVAPK